jgi:hypothetical protein
VITAAVLAGTVRRGQQRVHFRLVEIAEAGPVVSFEGHRSDLAAPGNQLWTSLADKGGQGVDCRQSLVARPDAASSALLDVPKKATHHGLRDKRRGGTITQCHTAPTPALQHRGSRSGVLRQNLSGVSSVVVANGSGVNRHDEREGRAAGMFRRTRVRSHVTRTLTCTVQQTR